MNTPSSVLFDAQSNDSLLVQPSMCAMVTDLPCMFQHIGRPGMMQQLIGIKDACFSHYVFNRAPALTPH